MQNLNITALADPEIIEKRERGRIQGLPTLPSLEFVLYYINPSTLFLSKLNMIIMMI